MDRGDDRPLNRPKRAGLDLKSSKIRRLGVSEIGQLMMFENVHRIEPARLETIPESIADLTAEINRAGALLGSRLHPTTAAQLAGHVRIMNTYYSNLIEGHDTRPRDIERAIAGDLSQDKDKRNLQLEAASHVRACITGVYSMVASRVLSWCARGSVAYAQLFQ